VEDPPLGLIDHPMGELTIGVQGLSHLLCQEYLSGIGRQVYLEEQPCPLVIAKALFGDVEKIEVVFLSGLFIFGIHDTHHPSLGPLRVVGEGDIEALHLGRCVGKGSSEHPNGVPQKA